MSNNLTDDSREPDFTWQKKTTIENYYPLGDIKVRWRVEIGEDQELKVIFSGYFYQTPASAIREKDNCRKEIFSALVSKQKDYLKSGEIQDLKEVTEKEVIDYCLEQNPDSQAGKRLRKEKVSSFTQDQYFYDPRGRVHFFGFLITQKKMMGGYPIYRICSELRKILHNEHETGKINSDAEILRVLKKRLPKEEFQKIKDKQFRRIRDSDWPKIWFPKKSDRRKYYEQKTKS